MSDQISFTAPMLCHYDYDLKKSWFVYFDITNDVTSVTLRKQFRGGINYWPDKLNRLKEGNALVKMWREKLRLAMYNPFGTTPGVANREHPKNIGDAVDRVFALKKASLKAKSVMGYSDISNRFKFWCGINRFSIIPVYGFNHDMAQAYCDHLLLERKVSGKTHNNHLNVMKAFFNVMKKRWPALVKENPFCNIDMLPTDVGGNVAYSAKERTTLIDYFKKNDKRVYYAIQFMFHCFIRKTELTYLKVGDINWETGTITINSYAAKSRIQDSVTIPEGLMPILYEMGLDMAPKNFFIFGYAMNTVAERINKPDNISDAHMRGKLKAGFKKNDGKSFYSWKHSGVVSYWGVIKDPYYMMRQLRHSDLKVTMVYMKSLGLMPNEAFKNARVIL